MYEVFEHPADLGLHTTGGSREELCSEAGRALASLLVPNLEADVVHRANLAHQVARMRPIGVVKG